MTDLWLAVDGGQTATIAIVAASDGGIRSVGRGGPLLHHAETGARDAARHAIAVAVGDAIAAIGAGESVVCACLAVTGSEGFAAGAARELLPDAHVRVLESDALAALATGTLGDGGIGLIAGTGTVAVAKGRRGGPVQRGGWGWLIGDEGGGYWIGIEAIRAAARDADGHGPQTMLTTTLPARLQQADMRGVRELGTGHGLDRAAIAALTEDVVTTADDGDDVAASILDEAARRLSSLALATIRAAPFLEPDERVIVGSGGVLGAHRVVGHLAELLAVEAPDFRFLVPGVPPVIGAYYLALVEHGIPITDATRTRIVDDAERLQLGRKVLRNGAPEPRVSSEPGRAGSVWS